MRLVAEGKIALNAPISRYLPGLLPDGDRITVRELLQHTSGLHDYEHDARITAPIVAGDLRHPWTPLELIAVAVSQPLDFEPGSNFSYSSSNTIALGLLAEHVGGESYSEQLRKYIFGSLKLSHTTLPTDEDALPDVHGYLALTLFDKNASPAVIDATAIAPSPAWSAGAIHSTVEDVATFFRGLFTGKLLPQADVAEMEKTGGANGAYGLGLIPTGRNAYHWGSNTQRINTTCGRAWGHGGNFPGYYHLPVSSPNGSRQTVLLLNADPSLMTQKQSKRAYSLLATAYCRGVPTR
jgi:D-alanyl-D-alanine carboxypeptidase